MTLRFLKKLTPKPTTESTASERALAASPASSAKSDRLHRQIFRFMTFGAFSTAVDFATLNLFIYVIHIPSVAANVISISVSLAVSYGINRRLVFRRRPPTRRHIVYFLIITMVGLYGLQSGVFELTSQYPLAQSTIAGYLSNILSYVPFTALESNVVKLMATLASGVWNFFFFRKFIFTGKSALATS